MRKKGQVTIFIILAILIVLIVSLFFFIPKKMDKVQEVDIDKVYSYMYDLVEEKSFMCFQEVGTKGGYYNIPDEIYVDGTSYWYYKGKNIQPFLNIIENETEKCIDEVLRDTVYDVLDIFGNESLKISGEGLKSNVIISEWRTRIEVNYPIVLSNGESSSSLSEFKIDYKINILKLYEIASGVVNHAALPSFDKCNPSANCQGEGINFTFFNKGEDLFIKGQTFAVSSNKTMEEPYELIFAIKRPIGEAFSGDGKRLAVLYQDDGELETFGERSLEVLNNLKLSNIDYYDCDGVSDFITKIDNYDVVVITGNLQFQIVLFAIIDSITGDESEGASKGGSPPNDARLIAGCNSFNSVERKNILKNWINSGGLLWINNVEKYEAGNFAFSYLGCLGYQGGGWSTLSPLDIEGSLLKQVEEDRGIVSDSQISDKNHYLLTCPNDISQDIVGIWKSATMKVGNSDDIIIGSRDDAILWIRNLGEGFIIFDQFILKDNIYEKLNYNDDLFSKGIAEKYFVNVLNYLSKFEKKKKLDLKISLISPVVGSELEFPIFEFTSDLEKNISYDLLFINQSGDSSLLELESEDIMREPFSVNVLTIDLANNPVWSNLSNGIYEWQIKTENHFSNIGSFVKKEYSANQEVIVNETAI